MPILLYSFIAMENIIKSSCDGEMRREMIEELLVIKDPSKILEIVKGWRKEFSGEIDSFKEENKFLIELIKKETELISDLQANVLLLESKFEYLSEKIKE